MTLDGKTILIRGTNWIGDTIMSLPAIREIKRLYPNSRLVVAVRPSLAGVYAWVPEVDGVMLYRKDQHSRRRAFHQLMGEIRALRPDAYLCFQNAFEAALLGFCSRVPDRIGYARDGRSLLLTRRVSIPSELDRLHQVYYYLHLLRGAGLSEVDYLTVGGNFKPDMTLTRPARMHELASRWFDEAGVPDRKLLIGIHAGAFYGSAKRWLPERFAEVIARLRRTFDACFLIFGTQSEKPLADTIVEHTGAEGIYNLCGKTNAEELVALIAFCHLFLSNDSGPMHVAAAFQIPQVAIFGSTDPVATGPFNPRSVVIKKPVECSPCFLRECPVDLRCFRNVTVEEVYQRSVELLYREYSPRR